MTVDSLLENLAARQIKIFVEGDQLVVRPGNKLTAEDRDRIKLHKAELLAALRNGAADGEDLTTPQSIIEVCARYGVALRIDQDGDLVVGRPGAKAHEDSQPWPALVAALEANVEGVARLVEAGWTLKARLGGETTA